MSSCSQLGSRGTQTGRAVAGFLGPQVTAQAAGADAGHYARLAPHGSPATRCQAPPAGPSARLSHFLAGPPGRVSMSFAGVAIV